MARQDFNTLARIWSHASVRIRRKLEILGSCVVSMLLYGLHTAYLNRAELQRLDGFYARCLRRVLRIPPAYYSRVSNETVLNRARRSKLSTRLQRQQLLYLGSVARRDDDDPVRCCVFQPGGVALRKKGKMKQGRPRKSWSDETLKTAIEAAGSLEAFQSLMAPTPRAEEAWRSKVRRYHNNL